MADNAYLFLKGKKQGKIDGEPTVTSMERKGAIECIAYEHGIHIPYDNLSGAPTGKRQYTAIKITKRIDSATPLIQNACTTNEEVEGTIKFYRPHKQGETEQFFTVAFTKGHIVSTKQMILDTLNPQMKPYAPLEEVSFVFSKITWTYTNGGKECQDTWAAEDA